MTDLRNIILIGLRGSGKTTIGRALAAKINRQFIDLDEEIVKFSGQSIPEIIATKGWPGFRQIEHAACQRVAHSARGAVIACGGGTIIMPQNSKILKKMGRIIYLHISAELAHERIKDDLNRPPITDLPLLDEMRHLYETRDSIYRRYAQKTVEADDINKILHEIIDGTENK